MIRHAASMLLLAALLPGSLAGAAPPSLQDIAGTWVAGKALRTILEKRSPHAAVAESVTITPAASGTERHRHGDRLDWNDGHEASWRRIVRVETLAAGRLALVTGPWEQETPAAKDLVRVPLRLERDAAGKVQTLNFLDDSLVQAHGQPFIRLDEGVTAYLNRRLLAGSYRDAHGKTWRFTPDGKAVWPDRSFSYEVSIDDSEADCDYIFYPREGEVGGYKRYGFRWGKGVLRLYSIAYPENGAAPLHCTKAMAELKPI